MKSLDVAVILAIVSVLHVSSDVASVGLTIGLENARPVPAAGAKPAVSRSGREVQRSVEENSDKRDALSLLLLLRMFGDGGRR
jgi:hypothetical protein